MQEHQCSVKNRSDMEELASQEDRFDLSYGGIEDMFPKGCSITAHAEGLNGLKAVKVPGDNRIRIERNFQVGEDSSQIIGRDMPFILVDFFIDFT